MNKEIKINLNKIMIVNDKGQTLELKGIVEPMLSNEDCVELMKSKEVKIVYEVKKEEILDKEEKKYLASVIKPFRDRIDCVYKCEYGYNKQYIEMRLYNGDTLLLPNFDNNTMYKGMQLYKNYTLEELGL